MHECYTWLNLNRLSASASLNIHRYNSSYDTLPIYSSRVIYEYMLPGWIPDVVRVCFSMYFTRWTPAVPPHTTRAAINLRHTVRVRSDTPCSRAVHIIADNRFERYTGPTLSQCTHVFLSKWYACSSPRARRWEVRENCTIFLIVLIFVLDSRR